ncbi:Serine palmitoyltransferase 1 [Dirofilaria immitis]|nr:Serine palmitoyltransferase 1 [Dirofilaria immitis]
MSSHHEEDYLINCLSTHIFSSSYKQLITESIILSAVIYGVIVLRFRKRKHTWLTEQQKERIITEWKPEPLVAEIPAEHPALQTHYFDGSFFSGKSANLSLTMAKIFKFGDDKFLGLVGDKTVEKEAKEAISKYGVGSCGPRHFYGTVDVHLALEKQLADFLKCEETVLFSYGFVTISSIIPSYAKRRDIIYADEGVNFAIQEGLRASRSHIKWFNHNDMNDLERLLMEQAEWDREFPTLASKKRRFLVVEGLYMNSGDLCPLPKIMALKWKYKVRILIDESLSIGVIGKTGRGVTEHFGIDPIDCDMIVGSLEHAFSSTGGFCAGRTFVVHHQRLSSLGYCFSASLPPLLAVAASKSLDIISNDPNRLMRLRQNCKTVIVGLKEALKMRERGYLLARAFYHPGELFIPKSSIRLSIQSEMLHNELTSFIETMKEEAQKVNKF